MNTLRNFFLANVEKAPDNLFLSDARRFFTYQQVLAVSSLRAHMLRDAGCLSGERVLIVDNDPLETSFWLLACSLIGVVFLILHADTPTRKIEIASQDIDPVGIIDTRVGYKDIYQEKIKFRFLYGDKYREGDESNLMDIPSAPDTIETDPAFLVYTSGSTKEPKAVICPHRSVLAVTSSINAYLRNSSQERIGHLLSLSFVYGLYQIFLAIQVQASIIFLEKFRSPIELIVQLRVHRVTGFPALRLVLSYLARLENTDIETLRYITCAGDFLPLEIIKNILGHFPNCLIFYMYGQSECSRALYMDPRRLSCKPASVGRAIPGTRAFLVNEAGNLAPPGEVGELVVEGPHIMSGYWNAPEETRAKFFLGPHGQSRLRTGDLFTQDDEGDFYFVSRKDDLIKSRGFRISPREVESLILLADPMVKDCLAYGVEDKVLGQAIYAQVIVNDFSHTESTILMRCRAMLEPHLVPTKIQVVNVLPTTLSGKYYRGVTGRDLTSRIINSVSARPREKHGRADTGLL